MATNVYPLVPLPEPWTPAQATERIRRSAGDDEFSLILAGHAEEQMEERGLTIPDIMYVLQNGFVYDKPTKATKWGLFKYAVVNPSPNSNRREVRVIAIPSAGAPCAKVVTVMWADEVVVGG